MSQPHHSGDGRPLRLLRVDSSARNVGSVSRRLGDLLLRRLSELHGEIEVVHRDTSSGLPFVDADWVGANFTDPAERSEEHRAALVLSDQLVEELKQADVLMIGVAIYNFGIPASLKAWVDMVARARETFRYTKNGPVGLLESTTAYLVVASGGTRVGSDMDFATPYLRHVLAFLGVEDVHIIAADRLTARGDAAITSAAEQISRVGAEAAANS